MLQHYAKTPACYNFLHAIGQLKSPVACKGGPCPAEMLLPCLARPRTSKDLHSLQYLPGTIDSLQEAPNAASW